MIAATADEPLVRLPDGTVKQRNPFTGTDVWTVPGRGNRPLPTAAVEPEPIPRMRTGRFCAFCDRRYLETTPEILRVVRVGERWETRERVPLAQLDASVADFRVFPNLFEIVAFDYWRQNHGHEASPEHWAALRAHLSTPAGREHLRSLVAAKLRAAGVGEDTVANLSGPQLEQQAIGFFASSHLVVVARRHYVERATSTEQLASSSTLTRDEHEQYIRLTVTAMRRVYDENPYVRYVAAFQNWLRPAGASFDHLHKQLVGVDDLGSGLRSQIERLAGEPDLYQRWGIDYAREQGLVVTENEHAILTAGIGHRYPSLEVWAKAPGRPWELTDDALRDWAALVHAAHRAAGVAVPSNEEWHHQPPGVDAPMPLRTVIKWRINTTAGFEGGTKIYVNTIDPWTLAERVRAALAPRRETAMVD